MVRHNFLAKKGGHLKPNRKNNFFSSFTTQLHIAHYIDDGTHIISLPNALAFYNSNDQKTNTNYCTFHINHSILCTNLQ